MDTTVKEAFSFGNDPIVIRKRIAGYKGGRLLDLTGFTGDYIRAGHIVITKGDAFRPMPVTSAGAYDTLPDGWSYAGVCGGTKEAKEPFVDIIYNGEVNDKCLPYELTAAMKSAIKTAVPTLTFIHD